MDALQPGPHLNINANCDSMDCSRQSRLHLLGPIATLFTDMAGGGKGGREGGVNGAISDDIMMIMVDYSY